MKKIFISIICFLSFSLNTEAFLGEDLGLNLYNSIDEGFQELELKQYEYELSGQGKTIKENINNILANEGIGECIEGEISSSDVQKIFNGSIDILISHMKESEECKTKDGSISNSTLLNIKKVIDKLQIDSSNKAKEKTEKINRISKIGIYSDGNIENGPFDLVKDLQDIDQIIFASKINYEGEELLSDDELINCITGEEKCFKKNGDIEGLEPEEPQIIKDLKDRIINGGSNETEESTNTNEQESELSNHYVCVDDINSNSGLSTDVLSNIINDIKSGNNSTQNTNLEKTTTNSSPTAGSNTQKKERSFDIGDYQKVNDPWPCYDFFCITVEFITYQHKLLIGGENISIEYLINRSNKHLKKFAATSLVPAKMSTNNFELGIKNMILDKMFHMGFVITTKPVPILDVKPSSGKEKNLLHKYVKSRLLETYYKNIGLEYSRKNDLSKFDQEEGETKNLLDSAEYSIEKVTEKTKKYEEILKNQSKKNTILQKEIEQYASSKELDDFEQQFIELQGFSESMKEYTTTIHSLIKEMLKIPEG